MEWEILINMMDKNTQISKGVNKISYGTLLIVPPEYLQSYCTVTQTYSKVGNGTMPQGQEHTNTLGIDCSIQRPTEYT